MDKFHFSQFEFPKKTEEASQKPLIKKRLRFFDRSFGNSQSNAASPVIRFQKVYPSDLQTIRKTSISNVEDHFKGQTHNHKSNKKNKSRLKDSSHFYRKIIISLEKQKEKRAKTIQKAKNRARDNPWRYSLTDSCCVFDVGLLARSTFNSENKKNEWLC